MSAVTIPFPLPDGATPEGRRKLLANGYQPIILNGKAPLSKGWHSGEINVERLATWEDENPNGGNTGLRCGTLAVADVDIWDPTHTDAVTNLICQRLGETVLRRVGQKGVALLFHNTSDPVRKITVAGRVPDAELGKETQKLEFLGVGQQVAAFGIHPDTGQSYDWYEASFSDPVETPITALPSVDGDMIRACAYAVRDYLTELGWQDVRVTGDVSGKTRDGSRKTGQPVTAEMLEAMLSHIDPACDRNTWIKIAGGITSAHVLDIETGDDDADFDGAALFDKWSSGALNPEHSPGNYLGRGDCDKAFESVTAGRSGGSGVGSIVVMAREGGYSGPSTVSLVERIRGTGEGAGHGVFVDDGSESEDWFAPVAALNERFAIVTGGKQAGRFVDLANPREPVFLDGTRFHLMFRDQKVTPPASEADSNPKPVPVSKLWEAWKGRRTVTEIVFVPPGSNAKLPKGAHNLWQGFAVEPMEGEAHKPLLAHIYNNVCDRDKELYRWLLSWLANLIQEPGCKPGVAIALEGEQGAGKTILYRYLEAIFGGHAASVDDPKLVVGNFNAHMVGLCLLGVEEGFWAGDRRAESKLKNLITAETVLMEQKGVDAIKIASHVHIMVTSNSGWVVPVPGDDRRWAVFHVDSSRRNDEAYWKPIYAALEGDGPANLLHYLLKLKYERSILFRPPMTSAKVAQAVHSMESVEQWWLDVLRGDREPVAGRVASKEDESRTDGVFEADAAKETIYRDYQAWCDGSRRFKSVTSTHFWKKFRKLVGAAYNESRPRNDAGVSGPRVAWFPARKICQDHFAGLMGCRWEDLDE